LKTVIQGIGAFILLAPCVVSDLKKHKLSFFHLLAVTLCAFLFNLVFRYVEILPIILGGLFGGLFFLISKITKEKIGYGDSFLLFSTGIWLGIEALLSISLLAFFICGLFGFCHWVCHRIEKQKQIPFAPFLAIATGIEIILAGVLS